MESVTCERRTGRTDVGVSGCLLLHGVLQGEDAAKERNIEHGNESLHDGRFVVA